jgi:predicted amidohydrolase YtcJ
MSADLLLEGRIFRGLAGGFAEAVAVKDGHVAAVGTRAEVEAATGPGTRRIALGGRVAIPAFNEAHMHLLPYGLGLAQVNLRAEEVTSLDGLLGRIREAARAAPKQAWVLGRGYDHGALDVGRHPTAAELDAAALDNPVWIVRTCGHMAVANSAALRMAGVGHNTPDPEGGIIERRGGALTGLVQERAMRLVASAIPQPDQARMVEAIEVRAATSPRWGFASATDMNVGMTAGMAEIAPTRRRSATGGCRCACGRCWRGSGGHCRGGWEAGLRPMEAMTRCAGGR